ncbi:MAG TPA: hypothetical protein VNO55_29775 [Polyangia bacterium]|nr:hypothetical protein [Polyangia bacterium]
MRSRLALLGAALCSVLVVAGMAIPGAFAAGPKGKAAAAKKAAASPAAAAADAAKKKPAELLIDDRAINKQMQWEDKVMGSNAAKKAELAKIARAQAITKAAEQAAAEKAASAPPPPPVASKPATAKSTVALPALPDEGDAKNGKSDHGAKGREISPKLATQEASAPVPAAKPADDKFIDKLLSNEGSAKKRAGAKAANDNELEQLLAKEVEKPGAKRKTKGGKRDVVDNLLENAGKPGDPATAPKTGKTPGWEAMEPLPTPPPLAPVAVKKQAAAKHDDGVIHVVQGANYSIPSPARATAAPPPSPPVDNAPKAAGWKDPFADNPAGARRVASASPTPAASRAAPATARVEKAPAVMPPPPAPAHAAGWKDPFADSPEQNKTKHAAPSEPKAEPKRKQPVEAPAHNPAGWKDPFAEAGSDSKAAGGADAKRRELTSTAGEAVVSDPPESKWKLAERRPAAKPAASVDGRSRWSVLKKR